MEREITRKREITRDRETIKCDTLISKSIFC